MKLLPMKPQPPVTSTDCICDSRGDAGPDRAGMVTITAGAGRGQPGGPPPPEEAWPYLVFFAGVALTAFGSGYYHLRPTNARLVWDRLPIAMAFMALFAAVVGERVSVRLGLALLGPLMAAGLGSVFWWTFTE